MIQQKKEPVKFADSVDINPAKRKLLISGYINEWNKKQGDVNNKQIPNELLIIILKFYPSHNIIFAQSGSKLYKQSYDQTCTGLLNVIFNDKMCDKVKIQFRLKTEMSGGFSFGYLYKWKDGSDQLAAEGKSLGVYIGSFGGYFEGTIPNEGIINIVLDFKNDSFAACHKQDYLDTWKLYDRKRIVPGFTLPSGTTIEFVGCSFD